MNSSKQTMRFRIIRIIYFIRKSNFQFDFKLKLQFNLMFIRIPLV